MFSSASASRKKGSTIAKPNTYIYILYTYIYIYIHIMYIFFLFLFACLDMRHIYTPAPMLEN